MYLLQQSVVYSSAQQRQSPSPQVSVVSHIPSGDGRYIVSMANDHGDKNGVETFMVSASEMHRNTKWSPPDGLRPRGSVWPIGYKNGYHLDQGWCWKGG